MFTSTKVANSQFQPEGIKEKCLKQSVRRTRVLMAVSDPG